MLEMHSVQYEQYEMISVRVLHSGAHKSACLQQGTDLVAHGASTVWIGDNFGKLAKYKKDRQTHTTNSGRLHSNRKHTSHNIY